MLFRPFRRVSLVVAITLLAVAASCATPATVANTPGGTVAPATPYATPTTRDPREAGGRAAGVAPLGIAYRLAFMTPASHLYDVELDVSGAVAGDTLRLQMPVWSPGRYARMDFARNVQRFRVEQADGQPVRWDKENGSLWRLYPGAGATGRLRVRYQVFANDLSGTFSVLDTAHANWNGASLFMYVVGHKADAVKLYVEAPSGWMLMSGDAKSTAQREFEFENYDRLIDTPTEVAPSITVDSFRVDGIVYRVMVHHNGPRPAGVQERFVNDVKRIVETENRVIAPPPLQRYTFLFNIGYAGGDGMEHLYSTEIISSKPWATTDTVLSGISTAAHEYFHTWNVKRVRPIALGPFDYTTEQYQPSLWVAEGWTNYYGHMTLHRAGIVDEASLLATLGGMIKYNSELPGRQDASAREASFNAPFWDGAAQPTQTNRDAHWISYYYKGEALAMLLDIEIRARTGGKRSLDDAMRNLKRRSWDQPNASYYLKGRGYTEADVEAAVSEAAGVDMSDWFGRYVASTEELPWKETLGKVGLTLDVSVEGSNGRKYMVGIDRAGTALQLRLAEAWATGRAVTVP